MRYSRAVMPSPVGELTLLASDAGLAAVLWDNDRPGRVPQVPSELDDQCAALRQTRGQLDEYFAGRRQTFTVALDPRGTPFQEAVWRALLTIPFGETRSYGQLAEQIGHPTAVRAVGAANGRNPISIIAPCHRVIGASGKLTGFAGGLERKEFLLRLEARRSDLFDRDLSRLG